MLSGRAARGGINSLKESSHERFYHKNIYNETVKFGIWEKTRTLKDFKEKSFKNSKNTLAMFSILWYNPPVVTNGRSATGQKVPA